MSRSWGRALVLSLWVVLLGVGQAFAKETVAENARLLAEAKDFRVRTQAALALGASGDKVALSALCSGLDDDNRTVRIASASALARLKLGGQGCLKRRLGAEKDELVRASLERSLEELDGGAERAIDGATRLYLAIDKLAGPQEWNAPFRRALVEALGGGVALAPAAEKPSAAARLLAKFPQARGFSLAFKAGQPEYTGEQMSLKLSVVIMSYPGKAILGSFSQKGAVSGLSAPSKAAEQELLTDLAASAMKKFLALAPTLEE